jgi:hypothetical protein
MCALALVGCGSSSPATLGAGGGIENSVAPIEESADLLADPSQSGTWTDPSAPESSDPWADPSAPEPSDPWADPSVPASPDQPAPDPSVDAIDTRDGAVVPERGECTRNALDYDNDGLCDSAEAQYGTERDNPDTDGDALSDGMEVLGIEFEGRTLDLAALGADPLRRDVFLEIDYTPGFRPYPRRREQ